MRPSLIGRLLLGFGLVVGVVAGVGLVVGFEPAELPRALLNIAAYKLTFLAAGGLIAAGALVLRYGRHDARRNADEIPGSRTRRLAEDTPDLTAVGSRQRDQAAGVERK